MRLTGALIYFCSEAISVNEAHKKEKMQAEVLLGGKATVLNLARLKEMT